VGPRRARMRSGEGFAMSNALVCNVQVIYVVRVNNTRILRWASHVAKMEEGRSAFKNVTCTPRGKRPLERPRCRWENNIRIDVKEIGINTKNWVIRLSIGIIGEPLWMRHWTSGFHKAWG